MAKVAFTNLVQFLSDISSDLADQADEVEREHIDIALQIRDRAESYAPVLTGKLRSSSFVEVGKNVSVGFDDDPPKAKTQEKRQSYLNRAVNELWPPAE